MTTLASVKDVARHDGASEAIRPRRSRLIVPFAISLALNMIALGAALYVIGGRGGVAYLKARLAHNAEAMVDPASPQRETLFEAVAHPPADGHPIVFLGDSLTSGCEWRELFGNRLLILNRGIGGDTSAGVLKRSPEVAALQPAAVFLMIGTNDLQALGYAPEDTVRNEREIISILQKSPGVRIYLESLLPTQTPKFNRWSEQVNQQLQGLADGKSVVWVNLRDSFLEDGALSKNLSVDGIHLNGNGYLLWKKQIDPIVAGLAKTGD